MEHTANDLVPSLEGDPDAGAGPGAGNYFCIASLDFLRRYPLPPNSQYSEYRSSEEYYSMDRSTLTPDVNAHLYSVSQRLPPRYSPVPRHADWDQHDPSGPSDPRESNSCDSLERSVMGSNLSSCSNQTATSSLATSSLGTVEQVAPTREAVSPPAAPGVSGSPVSSASYESTCGYLCVYSFSNVAMLLEVENEEKLEELSASDVLYTVLRCGEFNQPGRPLPESAFQLWICSPLLELQIPPKLKPWSLWSLWDCFLKMYSDASESKQASDVPVIRLQRNIFLSLEEEEKIKDWRAIRLLYEEARYNVVGGRYPLDASQAITLAGLQAAISRGHLDPSFNTLQHFRENQDDYLPQHARSGRWARLLPAGRKGSPEARLLEHMQRAASTSARKLRARYLEFCRSHICYGCTFFPGYVESPVRSLKSLLAHEDLPVLVGVNERGVFVIDDSRSDMLLGLLYEQMCWEIGQPPPDDPTGISCIFLQFVVIENGLHVSKILQVFSKQAQMIDDHIKFFAADWRRQRGFDTDEYFFTDSGKMPLPPLPPLPRSSSSHRLSNKLSRLALATHDPRGGLIGDAATRRPDVRLNQRQRPTPTGCL